ncbi:MAG: hypothetical protein WCF07_06395, partial [Nitrososphaeraceae archaeon]
LRFRLFKHDTPYFRSASPPSQHKYILDSSLEILRKLADCKRLKEELSVTPIRGTYFQFSRFPPQSVNAHPILTESQIQDLEIIGCQGIVCQSCLIAHPLAIYQVKDRPGVNPIMTRHGCNAERLSEVQQLPSQNRQNILADLYLQQLPRRILESVKEWTKNNCTLTAMEMEAPLEGCPLIDLLDEKEWAALAIKNGSVILTNVQLEDFIHVVQSATYANFRIVENKGNKKSCRIFFLSLRRNYPTLCY